VSPADIRRAATTAGIALLVVAVLGGFGYLAVIERLLVEDDATQTVANVVDSETLFRLGIVSLLLTAAFDVVVAWGLFRVFEPASNGLSMLAALFRVVYAAIFVVAIAQLFGALRLISENGPEGDASAEVLSRFLAYEDIWQGGLVLFGIHLLLLGVLAWRAPYAPTILGVLLVIAGLGYAIDGLGTVVFAGYSIELAAFTFVGEVVLIFWLLLRGRRLAPG
jgi:hypothetical protein